MLVEITIGVDPGLGGGVAILLGDQAIVYDVPKYKYKVMKRTKAKGMHEITRTDFDLPAMWEIFSKFQGTSDVNFCIEKVGVRSHDAKNSMFSFGQGVGYWKGLATAAGFSISEVTPQVWKKHYPDMLDVPEIKEARESIKALKAKEKVVKDKKEKSSIKKEIDSLNRDIKKGAKDAARAYAANLHPDIKDSFKLKKDDGKAEAVLISKWYREVGSRLKDNG